MPLSRPLADSLFPLLHGQSKAVMKNQPMEIPKTRRGFIETPDEQMHYRLAGEGEPLILLHQVPLSSLEFMDVHLGLATTYRVIAPDMLGYGCSDAPSRGLTMADYAAHLIQMMDELGIERSNLLGVHTGASLANEVAAAYPHRVHRLIYVGPPAWERWQDRYAFGFPLCHPFELDAEGASVKEEWSRLTPYTDNPTIVRRWLRGKIDAGPIFYAAYIAVFTYDFLSRFVNVEAPLLLLTANRDLLAENAEVLKKIRPNAHAVVVDDTSSWLAWEKPTRFIEEVDRFLSEATHSLDAGLVEFYKKLDGGA
jgi:pimeloyl-ACP methyl ester carboxylesterase